MLRFIHTAKNWGIVLLAAFPLLPFRWPPYLIGAVALFSLIEIIAFRKEIKPANLTGFLATSSVFFILVAAAFIYPSKAGWFTVEKSLSLLAFPLIFILNPKPLKSYTVGFVPIVFIFTLVWQVIDWNRYFYVNGFRRKIVQGIDGLDLYRMEWTDFTDLHPTYFSIMAWIAIFFSVRGILQGSNLKKGIIPLIVIIVLLIQIVALGARMPLIAGAAFLPVIILTTKAHVFRKIAAISLWLLAGIGGFTRLGGFERIKELNPGYNNAGRENSLSIRQHILDCSMGIWKENFWGGMGTEALQESMNECLMEKMPATAKRIVFNTHNQYIEYGSISGLPGLIAFIAGIVWLMILFIKQKGYPALIIMGMICICMLTENLLSRQMGIITWGLFTGVFVHIAMHPELMKMEAPKLPFKKKNKNTDDADFKGSALI